MRLIIMALTDGPKIIDAKSDFNITGSMFS